ncbi:hypothetical protein HYC85_022231 [Camellia sinensis]|uniref:Transmembrane protein n=1 Tax=Camellia sinensis TaxID=4442 RepID=A0A7J7GNR2_CAMSI|nr:hypothetical protein HYC85_022231 [Camellia sinensis]
MQSKSQQQEQHPWQIKVHAKSKLFDFKVNVTNTLSTSNSSPFPINLNLNLSLCPSVFQFKNKPDPQLPLPRKGKSFKFLRFLGKIRHPHTKKKASSVKQISNLGHQEPHFPVNQPRIFSHEEPVFVTSIVIGIISFLSQLISQKDHKGIILCSLIILLYLSLIFKKLVTMRTRNVLVIVIVAMLSCAIGVYLSNIFKISEGYVSNCVWKALNYSLKLFSFFAQVIHSRFSQHVGDQTGDNYWVT